MDAIVFNLVPIVWVTWVVYWTIAAYGTKTTEREESAASRLGHVLPLGLASWLLFARTLPGCRTGTWALFPPFFCDKIVAPGAAIYFTGVGVLIAGLAFAIWARHWLGRNWSGVVTLKEDHELVRGGPYRFVRHPIYTGILLGFVGSAIARDEWRGVLAVAIGYVALWRKLKLEECWMIERFGDAYRRFQEEVPALIPNPLRLRRATRAGTGR
jgi:protein-S-isoprenylcysteine O-methyltransferase Ste14